MDDLISRQAAKVSITRYFEVHIRNQKSRRLKEHAEEICRDICFGIDAWPSAQPKKGKWIIDEKRFGHKEHHCNLCGAILEGDDWKWRNNYYCYHCGAKMKTDWVQ